MADCAHFCCDVIYLGRSTGAASMARLGESDMPTAVESPIDFRQLKATLAASDSENPVNCVVASFGDRSVRIAVDRRRPGKLLARDLQGAEPARYFYGTAHYDKFPGTIFLTLNRSPSWLASRLRVALRGSGFGNVDIVIANGGDEEAY